ncbi:MAG: transcriptional repressor [bacterium]|nr:transcriptional repressor [bacterium]
MVEERLTSQKQIISNYLKSVKTHPTAEIIYSEVKKKLPGISPATVYRVLNNIQKKGNAQIIPIKGIAHFDADTSSHAHFICQKCNKVFDIFDLCSKCHILNKKRLKVGKISYYKIYFYGTCDKCKK